MAEKEKTLDDYKQEYKESIVSVKNILTLFIPGIIAVGILIFDFLKLWGNNLFDDVVLLAFLVGVIPFSAVKYFEFREIRAMEIELPNLLSDLSSSVEAGMALPQALYVAQGREYGHLTAEVRRMAQQVSWGIPFNDVLLKFGVRTKSMYIEKLIYLIVEANKTGGDIKEILLQAARNARDLKEIEREVSSMIKPYVVICYVVYFVFIAVIYILYSSFIQPLSTMGKTSFLASIDPLVYTQLFFHMLMFEGLFIGLAAGKMSEKKIVAGLRHSVILIILGYFIFHALVGWAWS
jgi:flagellar protein FlaJ